MPVKKLKDFLDNQHVKYICVTHSPAYTAQDVAQSAHISGKNVAKVVIIKADGKLAMVVVPATKNVNFDHLEKALGIHHIDLACEKDFATSFPECELGAIPPFGNLFGMDVYIVKELLNEDSIAFSAGNYSELIQIKFSDYEKLVHPKVIQI